MSKLASLILLPMLAACATAESPALTLISSPPYATIWELGGSQSAESPATVRYTKPPRDALGCITTKSFVVRWISGAQAITDQLKLCNGYANYQILIDRPKDAAGLDGDIYYAASRQAAGIQALSDGAEGLSYGLAGGRYGDPSPYQPPTYNCRQRAFGRVQCNPDPLP